MKAEKIVTEIEKLNKLGILKKEIVIKKGKDEDVAYLADTYIAAVNTLADDEIPENVAKFYNELGDEIDAQTLVEKKEEVVEEKVVEKKPAKAKDKTVVEKEAKKPVKKEVVKVKETKKEVVKEKPAKIVAKEKIEKKEEGKKVRTGWKEGSTCDKIHQLIINAGDKGISLESAVTKASKFDSREAYTKQIFGECIRYGLATKKDEKYFSVVKK
jgi:hypothetical protein